MKAKLLILALIMTMPLLFIVPIVPKARAFNRCDINQDGKVDILDVVLVSTQYALKLGDLGYNTTIVGRADLAPPYNGVINILDMVTMVSNYTG